MLVRFDEMVVQVPPDMLEPVGEWESQPHQNSGCGSSLQTAVVFEADFFDKRFAAAGILKNPG